MAFVCLFMTPKLSIGLVHEDCIAKMRLMTLVDLSSNDSGEIPYSAIKEALQVILFPSEHVAYAIFFFPVVKFYSEGMCYYHRLQKMRSNIGLLKQLPQSFLIVRWIRWTKQLLWGKCQCVLTHLHSLICTLFCESWSVVVWCAVGMQIVCLGQHNGKLSCQNLEFGG